MVDALGSLSLCEAVGIHHPIRFKNVLMFAHSGLWKGNYITPGYIDL